MTIHLETAFEEEGIYLIDEKYFAISSSAERVHELFKERDINFIKYDHMSFTLSQFKSLESYTSFILSDTFENRIMSATNEYLSDKFTPQSFLICNLNIKMINTQICKEFNDLAMALYDIIKRNGIKIEQLPFRVYNPDLETLILNKYKIDKGEEDTDKIMSRTGLNN
ncbi:hypothetical protein KY330_02595 [Candidatus Woesearchaeota archaeon]|nr:hypothetical protein [Candidatus Woesearchaeota archaeon]